MCQSLRVYLAGRCKGLEDGGVTWRQEIAKQLQAVAEWQDKQIDIFDPTKYFSYAEQKHKTQKQIKDYYFYQLQRCDIVILNANDTAESIGTAMEVQKAVDCGIPIIAWGKNNTYPWITEVDVMVLYDSMHEVVDFVRDYMWE